MPEAIGDATRQMVAPVEGGTQDINAAFHGVAVSIVSVTITDLIHWEGAVSTITDGAMASSNSNVHV